MERSWGRRNNENRVEGLDRAGTEFTFGLQFKTERIHQGTEDKATGNKRLVAGAGSWLNTVIHIQKEGRE